MKKVIGKEKGITLVALVITVIIMLILAGVAISALTSDDGLFEKTQGAANKYQQAAQNEADQIASLMNEINDYLNGLPTEEADKTAPTVATIEASDIAGTTFTLTATGEDETGIAKYEFYINGILEDTIITTDTTATLNVKNKTRNTPYTFYVKVYDAAGNNTQSSVGNLITKLVLKVGDYINYDAGTWISTDLTKITSSTGSPTVHSTVNDATSNNQALPTVQGQFGGFELGQSRNTNSKEYDSSYKPRTAGWRVWNIDETTGVVTLISAGHPETYYHTGGQSVASMNILKNRNCSMYENSYAQAGSAHILTGQEAATWYNKQFGTNYTIVENGENTASTFCNITFTTESPINVLENGSYYYFASQYSTISLYGLYPNARFVHDNGGHIACRSSYLSFSKG